ncbi:flagellar motor switch protein FliM [Sphingomonas sanxanigenens]|uniref:Flagellar motor switch protein FliN-like C-terminal domain-containing protein n=1 Tax=Sphingomonas sanxanigenens DSM 19645 = NX02 TaxID=1123269 RepID=W0AH73_9SPHN|nr:FliM/FliN family flagellar motor switch protein [Sphingomonas sanxanigenens]AHE55643.1 hypothetical protein NX02_19920 [Sphingomonas sanxanigenens DSM 19645 = NX02]
MTAAVRSWLPFEPDDRPVVRDTMHQAIEDWSARWVATGRWQLAWPGRQARAVAAAPGHARRTKNGIDVVPSARHAGEIAAAALMLPGGWEFGGSNADALVAAFEDRVIGDLAETLERVVAGDVPAAADRDGLVTINITDAKSGSALIQLSFPRVLLIELARTGMAPPRRRSRLEPIGQAVAPERVAIAVTLGVARLQIGEFANLVEGDVLVLDRAVTEPVDLCVAGTRWLGGQLLDSSAAETGISIKIID